MCSRIIALTFGLRNDGSLLKFSDEGFRFVVFLENILIHSDVLIQALCFKQFLKNTIHFILDNMFRTGTLRPTYVAIIVVILVIAQNAPADSAIVDGTDVNFADALCRQYTF